MLLPHNFVWIGLQANYAEAKERARVFVSILVFECVCEPSTNIQNLHVPISLFRELKTGQGVEEHEFLQGKLERCLMCFFFLADILL